MRDRKVIASGTTADSRAYEAVREQYTRRCRCESGRTYEPCGHRDVTEVMWALYVRRPGVTEKRDFTTRRALLAAVEEVRG